RIVRDSTGAATGFFLESAAIEYVWAYLDEITTDEDRDRFLDLAFATYLETGVTAATDMALGETELATFLRRLERDGRLPFPVSAHWLLRPTGDPEADLAALARAAEVRDLVAERFDT
ncbi:amidohydrolase, partial [Burkholderia multivorans]